MPRPKLSLFLLPLFAIGTFVPQTHAAPSRVEDISAIQPMRVLDTRIGLGAPTRPLDTGVDLAVSVAPPAGATSVMVNITAVDGVQDGWVKAWPCDEPRSNTSSLNFTPGIIAANAAIVRLAGGKVCLASSTAVNVVMDVTGWFFGTSDFSASSPNRLLDTRITGDPLQPGVERRLKVAGTPGINAGAAFAALNLTVDRPPRAGWVVAYPCGQPTNASTVNFSAGEIVANLTLVGLSGGDVCVKSLQATEIVIDSFGWSTGAGSLKVQSPTRLLDTRDNVAWGRGPSSSGNTLHLRVAGRSGVPLTADAALVTVTVANPTGNGFVTVWPCDQGFPLASTINTFPNALRSNLTLVKLSVVEGEACLQYRSSNLTPTDLIVDVTGWVTGDGVAKTYTASTEDFINPERGLFVQRENGPTEVLPAVRANGMSVVRYIFRLDPYKTTTTLPGSYLDSMRTRFADARAKGLKLEIRFVYDYTGGANPDTDLNYVLGHIQQLGPVLNENKDVLALIEAGFVGKWGEWWGSTHGLTDPTSMQQIIDHELKYFPQDIKISMRYPQDKQALFGTVPITAAEAHQSTVNKARIGFHNDCFLTDFNDQGTWPYNTSLIAPMKSYVNQDAQWVPMSGETCDIDGVNTTYANCANARTELTQQRWSLLNSDYYVPVLDLWYSQGCLTEIKQKLGYRLRITNANLPAHATPGSTITLNLNIANDGYAAPYNQRPVDVILRNTTTGAITRMHSTADPRTWLPSATTATQLNVTVPTGTPTGTYDLLLHLPDPSPTINNRTDYALRLANTGTWEPATGYNSLQHSVLVIGEVVD